MPIVLGLAGGPATTYGLVLVFIGGVLVLTDRTGTVRRRKSRRRSRSQSRDRKRKWVAPIELIDLRGHPDPTDDLSPDLPPVRTTPPQRTTPPPNTLRRRRPGSY